MNKKKQKNTIVVCDKFGVLSANDKTQQEVNAMEVAKLPSHMKFSPKIS